MEDEKMPLTIIEQLEQIPEKGHLTLTPDLPPRASWQQKVTELKKRSVKRFTIRTGTDGITKIWRLDDEPQIN